MTDSGERKSSERNELVTLQERIAKLELTIGGQGLSFTQVALGIGELVAEFRSIMGDLARKMDSDKVTADATLAALRALTESVQALVALQSLAPPEQKPAE